jgi:hypothetical protein
MGDERRSWYRARDVLTGICEHVIPETSTLEDTIGLIPPETELLAHRYVEPAGANAEATGTNDLWTPRTMADS